jgi:Flp pilus assembly protein TadD
MLPKQPVSSLLIVVLAVIPFLGVFPKEFTNWDDRSNIVQNEAIHYLTSANFYFLFTEVVGANYVPVTQLSQALDCSLYGDWAWGHALTNALLHAGCCLLLAQCAIQAGLAPGAAWLAAALFAVHPIHAEPVAWISGRKDLLCTFGLLLSQRSLLRYRKNPRPSTYAASLFWLAIAGLAKPAALSAVVVLWLVDVEILGQRPGNSLKSLLPHALICLLVASLAVWAQRSGQAIAFADDVRWGSSDRAAATLILDLGRCWIPYPFSPFYPGSVIDRIPAFARCGSLLLLVGASVFLLRHQPRWRLPRVAWFGSLGFLLPVCGLLPLGHTSLADRYLYVPSIAMCLTAGWLLTRIPKVPMRAIIAVVMLTVPAVITHLRARAWSDSTTLWQTTLAAYPTCALAWQNLTAAHYAAGDLVQALAVARRSLAAAPHDMKLAVNAAAILMETGEYAEAEQTLAQAEQQHAATPEILVKRGELALRQLRPRGALELFEQARQARPGWGEADLGLTYAWDQAGNAAQALSAARRAVEATPRDPAAAQRLIDLLLREQRVDEALAILETTTKRLPHARELWVAHVALLTSYSRLTEANEVRAKALRFVRPPLER